VSETGLYAWLLWAVVVSGLLTFVTLLFMPAPYGRHARPGWGPSLPAAAAWALMEAPSALTFAVVFARGPHVSGLAPWLLLALWEAHYLPRALVDPWRMRSRVQRTPAGIVATGALYNVVNGYLNAAAIVRFSPPLGAEWLVRPAGVAGLLLFVIGYATNRWADARLRALREHGEGGYGIPRGGLYEHVACPNYLGEIVQWCGWALLAGTAAGWTFALFTACNLVPRALAHRRWYRRQFPEYPSGRRALIPRIL
jgi:steroid 5-alpha-reductase/3-oxo-5-alpha-steroid 4-dehydrogenase 1